MNVMRIVTMAGLMLLFSSVSARYVVYDVPSEQYCEEVVYRPVVQQVPVYVQEPVVVRRYPVYTRRFYPRRRVVFSPARYCRPQPRIGFNFSFGF